MKTIGLLGGMSWESTALYYRWINEYVKQELGGLHSARIAMVSVDFQEIEDLQNKNKWDDAGWILSEAALQVEAAGADFLLICTNTMHKVAPQIEAAICIQTIQDGIIPPTINLVNSDPECNLDYVPNIARHTSVHTALSNSFGFGGHNSTLVFKKYDED
jgi:aspartate/glutamate racemase